MLSWQHNRPVALDSAVQTHPRLKRITASLPQTTREQFRHSLDLYVCLLNSYQKQQNKPYVGDKDPRLVEFIHAAAGLFPHARFLHMVRDPRDVLLSRKRAAWSGSRSSLYHIFVSYVQLKLGERMGRKLGRNRYRVVIYEELLSQPEKVLTGVCEFLEVDFENAMLHFQVQAEQLVAQDEYQWKKETLGPLLTENSGKWEGRLSAWEVALTESLCRQAFRIGGYTQSESIAGLSVVQRLMLPACTTALRGIGAVYVWYRLAYQKVWMIWKS
jgi:hypothetical protein